MRKVELIGIPLLAWRDIRVGHCSERYDDSYLDLYPDLAVFLTPFLRTVRKDSTFCCFAFQSTSALLQVQHCLNFELQAANYGFLSETKSELDLLPDMTAPGVLSLDDHDSPVGKPISSSHPHAGYQ